MQNFAIRTIPTRLKALLGFNPILSTYFSGVFQMPQLTYRQVQARIKSYKAQGLTHVRLNSSREALESELQAIRISILNDTEEIE